MRAARQTIGIADAEACEYLDFEPFHGSGLALGLVVVAQQMQHAMHHQMRDVIGEGFALGLGLRRDGLQRQNDIPQRCGRAVER